MGLDWCRCCSCIIIVITYLMLRKGIKEKAGLRPGFFFYNNLNIHAASSAPTMGPTIGIQL